MVKIINDWYWGKTVDIIEEHGLGLVRVDFIKDTTWGQIEGLKVEQSHRKKGIGKELMKYAEQTIIDCGYNESRLAVEKDRIWVFEWYRRLGYHLVEEDEELFFLVKHFP